jgi:hypothetical protein
MSFAAAGFNAGDFAAGDALANPDPAGPDSGHAVHPANVDRRAIGKGYVQKNRPGIFQVGVFLQNAHRLSAKADYRIASREVFNWPRSGRSVHACMFRNAGEHHFDSGVWRGGADQRANHTAPAETSGENENAQGETYGFLVHDQTEPMENC